MDNEEEKVFHYKLMFDKEQTIDVPEETRALKIYLSCWKGGSSMPKYVYLLFKSKYIDKQTFKEWENLFYNRTLTCIGVFDNTDKLDHVVPIPSPFIELHYEDGDMVVQYGNQLYADDAY